jgi:hypothetical protein
MKDTFLGLVALLLILAAPVGYVLNIVDLFKLDFQAPYKAEALRATGIFIPPLGVIEGLFVTFDEEKK